MAEVKGVRGQPVRLQLSRRKGFSLQALSLATNGLPAVNVARPGKWGNPFVVGEASGCEFNDDGDPAPMIPALTLDQCIEMYRSMIGGFLSPEMHPHGHRWMDRYRKQTGGYAHPSEGARRLAGFNLACFCGPTNRCHADVLLDLANPDSGGR